MYTNSIVFLFLILIEFYSISIEYFLHFSVQKVVSVDDFSMEQQSMLYSRGQSFGPNSLWNTDFYRVKFYGILQNFYRVFFVGISLQKMTSMGNSILWELNCPNYSFIMETTSIETNSFKKLSYRMWFLLNFYRNRFLLGNCRLGTSIASYQKSYRVFYRYWIE